MKDAFLSLLTQAINTYLKLDPESHLRLAKLTGRTITFKLLPFHFVFQCEFNEDHVDIKANDLLEADTIISGTPLQMVGVMMIKENRQRFFADDLTIEGDAEVGQQVIKLFDELNIDWEDYTARVIGDVPAYQLHRMGQRLRGFFQHLNDSFTDNVSEYIHEEKDWLPAREALQDLFSDIDNTRMDVDRAEVQLKAIQRQLDQHEVSE